MGEWLPTCPGFLGLSTDAQCMAVSRPLFSAFDDRTMITITSIIPCYFVLADCWASRNLRLVRRISTELVGSCELPSIPPVGARRRPESWIPALSITKWLRGPDLN